MSLIFFIMALLCTCYFAVIAVYSGITTDFCRIWLLLAAVFVLMGIFNRRDRRNRDEMPRRLPVFIYTTFGMAAVIAALTMTAVLDESNTEPKGGCDYLIVLGSRVYKDGISMTLKKRLDTAYEYSLSNPETIYVLSGGMDSGDPVPEALAMYSYMSMRGVPGSRLLIEPRSVSTSENILFSLDLIEEDLKKRRIPPPITTGIVTSDYHLMRALRIAQKLSREKIYGIPADSDPILFLHQCLRECFAILKDHMVGNL